MKGEFIISSFYVDRLNVVLTFNVKPESKNFSESLSTIQNIPSQTQPKIADTYAEWDTWETICALRDALAEYHDVTLVEADEKFFEKVNSIKPDIVFNVAEGINGISREAQVPAMLEMLDIPYTGSDPQTLSICLDKARTKEILTYYNIKNPKFIISETVDSTDDADLNFPLIVKPVCEGSSKGIFSSSFVNNSAELKKEVNRVINEYRQPALIEEFLEGREFTAAVLGNGAEAEVLPIVEINFNQFPSDFVPIYSYEAKWILDTKENPLDVFSCPAKIDEELELKIKNIVLSAYKTLRCKDWSRIDIRLDKHGEPNIIEVNPLPGILPNPEDNSCYPKAARTAGMNYTEMINKVLYAAAKRYKLL